MDYRKGSHTVYNIEYHVVWVTKYRYHVLTGDVQIRVRELIRQICQQHDLNILKGHVSKDHIHLLVSAPPIMRSAILCKSSKVGRLGCYNKSFRMCGSDTGANIFQSAISNLPPCRR